LAPVGYANGALTFTDVNGGVITASNIESLYVNNKQYALYLTTSTNPGNSIWGITDKILYGLEVRSGYGSNFSGINGLTNLSGFNLVSDNFTYIGNAGRDDLNLGSSSISL
jgi:hypothetical protein